MAGGDPRDLANLPEARIRHLSTERDEPATSATGSAPAAAAQAALPRPGDSR
jgi:hypothetical protein